MDNDRPVLDLMKMSPAESARVRRELEAAAAESGDANRRQSDRKAYPPRASAIVHILQAEWGSASFRIWPRNISGSGIGFLHGGFVYPGTRVMVELPRSGRDPVRLSGRVVRCVLVKGRVHDVGVRMERANGGESVQFQPLSLATCSEAIATLSGHVLFLSSALADQEHIPFQLRSLGLSVEAVKGVPEAIRAVQQHPYDLLIVDRHPRGGCGLAAMEAMVATQPQLRCLALIAQGDATEIAAAQRKGAHHVVTVPEDAVAVVQAVLELIQPGALEEADDEDEAA